MTRTVPSKISASALRDSHPDKQLNQTIRQVLLHGGPGNPTDTPNNATVFETWRGGFTRQQKAVARDRQLRPACISNAPRVSLRNSGSCDHYEALTVQELSVCLRHSSRGQPDRRRYRHFAEQRQIRGGRMSITRRNFVIAGAATVAASILRPKADGMASAEEAWRMEAPRTRARSTKKGLAGIAPLNSRLVTSWYYDWQLHPATHGMPLLHSPCHPLSASGWRPPP